MEPDNTQQQNTAQKGFSVTFTPEFLLTLISMGPYAIVGFILVYYFLVHKDLPPVAERLLETHGMWGVIVLLMLWLFTWLFKHFRAREQELISSLKDLTTRYENSSIENTRVLAGMYELLRVIHAEKTNDDK